MHSLSVGHKFRRSRGSAKKFLSIVKHSSSRSDQLHTHLRRECIAVTRLAVKNC
jgi:hypothetical protein